MIASELEQHLLRSTSEEKRTLLSTLPPMKDAPLFALVRSIACDEKEDDLCRIEAVKVVGLAGMNSSELHTDAMQTLLRLGLTTPSRRKELCFAAARLVTDAAPLPAAVKHLIDDDDILIAEAAFAIVCSQPASPDAARILKGLIDHPRVGASAKRQLSQG